MKSQIRPLVDIRYHATARHILCLTMLGKKEKFVRFILCEHLDSFCHLEIVLRTALNYLQQIHYLRRHTAYTHHIVVRFD